MANFKNKKLLLTLVTGLAGVAIIGTGFASWVITSEADPTSTGNVSFDADVDANTVALGNAVTKYYFTGRDSEAEVTTAGEKNIKFGPIASTNGNWLSSNLGTDKANEERLKVVTEFPITVHTTSSQTTLNITNLAFSVGDDDDDENNGYKKLVAAGIVGALPTFAATPAAGKYSIEAINGSDAVIANAVSVSGTTGTITFAGMAKLRLTVWFAWGAHFGGSNPITYYNDGKTAAGTRTDGVTFNSGNSTITTGVSETYGLDAENAIKALGLLDSATYKLSFHLAVASA